MTTITPDIIDKWSKYSHSDDNRGHANREEINSEIEKYINQSMKNAEQTAIRIKRDIDSTPKRILDLGSSTGFKSFALAKVFPEAEIYGVEPEELALSVANSLGELHSSEIKSPTFIQANGEDMPFPDLFFDLIVCHTVLEHVYDYKAVIAESARVSNHNAHFHLEGPNYLWPREPHLEIWCIPLLGKPLVKLFAILQGKISTISFLDHLQFITSKEIVNIFKSNNYSSKNLMKGKLRAIASGEEIKNKKYHFLAKILQFLKRIKTLTPLINLVSYLGISPSMLLLFQKQND